MDAFKLLSRSTKLRKSNFGPGEGRLQNVPSAGQTASPQLFGQRNDGDTTSLGHEPERGYKKRKRDRPEGIKSGDLPLELDFFAKPTGAPHSNANPQPLASDDNRKQDESVHYENLQMSEEERKNILRKHKIRVTCLALSSQSGPLTGEKGRLSSRKSKGPGEDSGTISSKQKKHGTELFPQPLLSFNDLRLVYGVSRRLTENVLNQGYQTPTEVQMGAIPLLLGHGSQQSATNSRHSIRQASGDGLGYSNLDLLTVAPTGSGKTLAFLIPVMEGLLRDRHQTSQTQRKSGPTSGEDTIGPRALIIVPTKELLAQIVNEGRKLAIGTGIRVTGMRKGMKLFHHTDEHERGDISSEFDPETRKGPVGTTMDEETSDNGAVVKADVLVTTPLSFLHAIKSAHGDTASPLLSVKYLILDEADVLLDPLFRDQTLDIWNACSNPSLRVSLWSATMGSSIETLAKERIQSREEALGLQQSKTSQLLRLVVGIKDSAVPNISHQLVYAATEPGKLLALRQLLHPSKALSGATPPLRPPFLVFTQTIPRAIALHSELLYDIPPEAGGSDRIAVLHSDLADAARDRVMTGFRKGEIWVLITTDILSRGVDFRGVNGVVNYDVPNSAAAYIHRGGRTGRAGRDGGVAVTLYTKEDIPYIKNVANVIAATEKLRGAPGKGETVLQKWFMDALPKVSKSEKQRLKRHGVEARNASSRPHEGQKSKERAKTRISTKSGYDRRIEHNRKGAMARGRRVVVVQEEEEDADLGDDSEWNGFSD